MLLQVLIGYSGEKRCKQWKTQRAVSVVTSWRETYVVTWLSWIRANGDGAWRHEWSMTAFYKLKMHRGIDGMFAFSSGLVCVLESTKIQESAAVAHCCHCQWPQGCGSQPDDLGWLASVGILARIQLSHVSTYVSRPYLTTETALCVFHFFTELFSWITSKNLQQHHCSSFAMQWGW